MDVPSEIPGSSQPSREKPHRLEPYFPQVNYGFSVDGASPSKVETISQVDPAMSLTGKKPEKKRKAKGPSRPSDEARLKYDNIQKRIVGCEGEAPKRPSRREKSGAGEPALHGKMTSPIENCGTRRLGS